MKHIFLNGLLAGLVYIIVYLIFHFINPRLNFDFTTGITLNTIIYLFFLIRAGFQQRKSLGGFLGFGEVFVSSIAIYAVGSFLGIMFTILMIELNPELIELMKESSIQAMESTLSIMGMSEEQIALEVEKANYNQDTNQLSSFGSMMIGWLIGIIFPGLIYVLIASFITKKKDKSIANQ